MLDSSIPPRDPNVTDPREKRRLSSQCAKMLRLFGRQARISNRALARISLKYTSRISDLRDAGYLVVCSEDLADQGLTWYTLRDIRTTPTRGYTLTVGSETRTIVAVRSDRRGRRWVLYRTARRMGVTRVLLGTWRVWAWSQPAINRRHPTQRYRPSVASPPMPRRRGARR